MIKVQTILIYGLKFSPSHTNALNIAYYPSVITLSPPVIITAIPKYFTLTVKLTGTMMGICYNLIEGVVVAFVVFVELVELSVVLVVVLVVVFNLCINKLTLIIQ